MKKIITKIKLSQVKLFLAVSSLLFALFDCVFTYGLWLVEYYREIYPSEVKFGQFLADTYFELLIKSIIVLVSYLFLILFLKKEENIFNQIVGLLLLQVILFQSGVFSFIFNIYEIPSKNLIWLNNIFSAEFLIAIGLLKILFWIISIVLVILQLITIHKIYKANKN